MTSTWEYISNSGDISLMLTHLVTLNLSDMFRDVLIIDVFDIEATFFLLQPTSVNLSTFH